MRISDWSSDVCSSDLQEGLQRALVDEDLACEPVVQGIVHRVTLSLIRGDAGRPWVVSHGKQRVGKRAHPFVFFSERHYRGENQRMPLLAKLSGCISRASARLSACVVLLACLLSGAVIAAPPAPVAEGAEIGTASCRARGCTSV